MSNPFNSDGKEDFETRRTSSQVKQLTLAQQKAFGEVQLMRSFSQLESFANKNVDVDDDNLFTDSDHERNVTEEPNLLDDYNPVTGLPWCR